MSTSSSDSSDDIEFAVITDVIDGVRVVHIRGEVDLETAPQLEEALMGIDSLPVDVLDLTDVSFIDSSGLSVLAQCRERWSKDDGSSSLRLVVTRTAILRVFEVTGLSDVLNVFDSVDEAIRGR